MPGRTLAIGDIHGCDAALETLLSRLELTADDTVVLLGDVVDRGPNTKRCIDLLLDARKSCRLFLLTGNHEQMMLNAICGGNLEATWLQCGGMAALDSYGGGYERVPRAHLEFLESGCDYCETLQDIFVHANLQPGVPLEKQSIEWLRWTHLAGSEAPHSSGRRVVCGHTSQKSGRPLLFAGWACIDTFAWGGEWLTCLDVETDLVFQAKQSGEYRGDVELQVAACVEFDDPTHPR